MSNKNKMKKFTCCFLLFFVTTFIARYSFAQNAAIDSLQNNLKIVKEDTNRVITYNLLSFELLKTADYSKADSFAHLAMLSAEKLGFKKGIAKAYNNIGISCWYQGRYAEALKNYFTAIKIRKEIGDKIGIASSYNNIGIIYMEQGKYTEAMENYAISLKIKEEIGDKKGIATSYGNIGSIYKFHGNYPEALKNYLASLEIKKEIGDKSGCAADYNNIGLIYYGQNNYTEALVNCLASLKIREEIGDKNGIADSYNNIGLIYYDQANYSEALKNYSASLEIRKEIRDKQGIAASYSNIGLIYKNQGNYPEAMKNYQSSLKIEEEIGNKYGMAESYVDIGMLNIKLKKLADAKKALDNALLFALKINSKKLITESYCNLSLLDSANGKWQSAYDNYKKYFNYRDSLKNDENTKKIVKWQMQYQFDIKENTLKAEQGKKDAIAQKEKQKQKFILFFVGFSLLFVLIFSGFMYNRWRVTQRQKHIIEDQKELVDAAYLLIEEKNKKITDSINYALRIQQVMLTNEEYISKNLPADFFILYQPKDIVSGDFYWAVKHNNAFYIATCDCTGHGVPGAFMSLLNISFLNENLIERNLTEPSDIINEQRKNIIKALNPKGTENSKDGMDCVLCKFDFDSLTLTYAAANNPLWIVRDKQLIEYKADKMPVGKYNETDKAFIQQAIPLKKGDTIYTFTDGYADQFGGENGKKFKYKQIENLLLSMQDKSMAEQKIILTKTITNWKGSLEQVDDILVIGIRV